jgi:hypothetical protein
MSAYSKKYWKNNKKKIQKRKRKYYLKNKERVTLANLKRNTTKGFVYRLKTRYNMTEEQYWYIFEKQDGGCYICKSTPKKRNLAVDHCHKTGQVRGLLCMNCNQGLQKFRDVPERFRTAYEYLTKDHQEFTKVYMRKIVDKDSG